MTKKKKAKVNLAMYEQAKALLSYGLKVTQVSNVLGLGRTTVWRINQTESLEEFKNASKHKPKIDPTKMDVKVMPKEEMDNHNSVVSLLRSIEFNQTQQISQMGELTHAINRQITLLQEIIKNTTKKGLFS